MLKKCASYFRGFIRPQVLLIILILLVTVYFYQDKMREISSQVIDSNRNSGGAIFYLEGIWNKMKRVQQINDNRSQRVMELFEEPKAINSKSGLFSIEIPKSWILSEELSAGNQIAKMVAESSNFSKHESDGGVFYDNGAQITIQVIRGEQKKAKLPDGGFGSMLIKKESIYVAGENINYYIIKDPAVKEGEIIEAYVLRGGNTFIFRLADNPKSFPGGEYSFQEIARSLKFR